MLRAAVLAPVLAAAVVIAAANAAAAPARPSATVPVPVRSSAPVPEPVVYRPACDDTSVVPARRPKPRPKPRPVLPVPSGPTVSPEPVTFEPPRDRECPRRMRVGPGAECFSPLPGDFAVLPTPPVEPRPGLGPRPRSAPEPPLPERLCVETVPAASAASAQP